MSKRTLSFRVICCFISGVLFLLSDGCAAEQRTQMQETQREELREEQLDKTPEPKVTEVERRSFLE